MTHSSVGHRLRRMNLYVCVLLLLFLMRSTPNGVCCRGSGAERVVGEVQDAGEGETLQEVERLEEIETVLHRHRQGVLCVAHQPTVSTSTIAQIAGTPLLRVMCTSFFVCIVVYVGRGMSCSLAGTTHETTQSVFVN